MTIVIPSLCPRCGGSTGEILVWEQEALRADLGPVLRYRTTACPCGAFHRVEIFAVGSGRRRDWAGEGESDGSGSGHPGGIR